MGAGWGVSGGGFVGLKVVQGEFIEVDSATVFRVTGGLRIQGAAAGRWSGGSSVVGWASLGRARSLSERRPQPGGARLVSVLV